MWHWQSGAEFPCRAISEKQVLQHRKHSQNCKCVIAKTFPVFICHHCQHHTSMEQETRCILWMSKQSCTWAWHGLLKIVLNGSPAKHKDPVSQHQGPCKTASFWRPVMRIQLSKVQGLDANCAPSICWIFLSIHFLNVAQNPKYETPKSTALQFSVLCPCPALFLSESQGFLLWRTESLAQWWPSHNTPLKPKVSQHVETTKWITAFTYFTKCPSISSFWTRSRKLSFSCTGGAHYGTDIGCGTRRLIWPNSLLRKLK